MKYMGSKRAMLEMGLGDVISRELNPNARFFDLFTGSGSVACFVAENFPIEVVATDLQGYATTLTHAVIGRSSAINFESWAPEWIAAAISNVERQSDTMDMAKLQSRLHLDNLVKQAATARKQAANSDSDFVRAYGGWYFSPWQASLLDALRQAADPNEPWYDVAVAAVIQAASRCVAAPGHTAQPFKAETGAAPFLHESWQKDIIAHVTMSAGAICQRHAKVEGHAYVADAQLAAGEMREGDVAFLDPPYSSVHYSRFYHVLESLARGVTGEVSGMGRYPAPEQRPSSEYSIPTRSEDAMQRLLDEVAKAGAKAIITFPSSETSNRLSGEKIAKMAKDRFKVKHHKVVSRFSTLGGDHKHRGARQDTEEMILTLETL